MAKHAAPAHARKPSAPAKETSEAVPSGRIPSWAHEHPVVSTVLLAASCFLAFALIFIFVVFTDFGASADFIYNQF
ncbi:MAG: hypothetical protein IJ131_10185 [Eggerthellaceae bacterium]|nr:hypothetical protein [Eggerthellaceae bacterium]